MTTTITYITHTNDYRNEKYIISLINKLPITLTMTMTDFVVFITLSTNQKIITVIGHYRQ